jgi:alpha-L-fucosidase
LAENYPFHPKKSNQIKQLKPMRKTVLMCIVILTMCSFKNNPAHLPIPSEKPNKAQKAQIQRKYGMFMHFGVNTFVDQEWTDGSIPAMKYAPKKLDTDQWIRTAKEAGMKYVIMITKHHDGFCMWDSKYTDYDVASSANTTNVVEEVAKSCKKYGVRLGIYYSLWDRKENPNTRDSTLDAAYNQYMLNQLTEIMDITSKYGRIVELWFDGSWEKANNRWPLQEIYNLVKAREPECQISTNWTIGYPDKVDKTCKPSDQKEGYPIRYFPSDFRLGDPDLPANPDPKAFTHDGKKYYMPWESTVCISSKWFYNSKDHKYKTIDQLFDLYKTATAQDNILILNCPPTTEGVIRQEDIDRLMGLRAKIESKENNSKK